MIYNARVSRAANPGVPVAASSTNTGSDFLFKLSLHCSCQVQVENRQNGACRQSTSQQNLSQRVMFQTHA